MKIGYTGEESKHIYFMQDSVKLKWRIAIGYLYAIHLYSYELIFATRD